MLSVLAAEVEEKAPIVFDPVWFAVIAAAVFVALALVTWSYRDVANRHSDKTAPADGHDAHGGH